MRLSAVTSKRWPGRTGGCSTAVPASGTLTGFAADAESAIQLVQRGWWADDGESWQIVHNHTEQRTAEQVLADRESAKKFAHFRSVVSS